MTRTILIDADILAYRASAATQQTYLWDGSTPSTAAHLDQATEAVEEEVMRLVDHLKADDVIVCLSDDFSSFRKHLVDPTYKGIRASVEKPVHLYDVKDFLRETYTTEERPTLEADDVLGILATDPSRKDERIIVSADKDLMTVPGRLYRPQHQHDAKRAHILDITPLEAIRFHFWQTITGDSTDGYPGCPGIGPLSPFAEDVLAAESEEEAWEEVIHAYGSKGLTEEHAIRQARLAHILQFGDYTDRRVSLWVPPGFPEEDD